MDTNFLTGDLVRLVTPETEQAAACFARWSRDSEYLRFLDTDPARPLVEKWWKEDAEKREPRDNFFPFFIQTIADNKLIGFIGFWFVMWNNADTFVGIGIGEPEYRGKGYGTDAMRIMLRFAFHEINLHRVTLVVFAYNPRAIRSYEKAGFVLEGRERNVIMRDGERHDIYTMGILRSEWEKTQLKAKG